MLARCADGSVLIDAMEAVHVTLVKEPLMVKLCQ